MEEHIVDKLRKVLTLTTSPVEGEAQAAAFKLQELLVKYNLDIADLETRGKAKSQVQEEGHDLGKAAFTWKLNLAEGVAKHYYCHPLVDRKEKTVRFVGRPDNVDSLKILYQWLIDQIKRISSDDRKKWERETGEHVDPLRWQVNFGLGATSRLIDRLVEKSEKSREDARCLALVVHHDTEISDYLEKTRGYRTDGKETKQAREWREDWERREKEKQELKEKDLEEYYRRYPWYKPLTEEEKIEKEKADKEWEKKWQRRTKARERYYETHTTSRDTRYKPQTEEEIRKSRQSKSANDLGRQAGNRINLEPFVEDHGHQDLHQIG